MKRISLLFISVLTLFVMNSCDQKKQADVIVTNATVYTVNEDFSKVESFAVVDGKVAETGTSENILSKYASENMVDANGKFVYPGFNDAHCHFNGYGVNLMQYADLRGTESPEEIYEILKKHH
jgi:predicted amidohydrolase YtcJ